MFAPLPRTKRQRSSSPPISTEYIDLTSPLDILIKRRRRDAGFGYPFPDTTPPVQSANVNDQTPGEGSTSWLSRPSINGRRSRQWQHLNAPSSQSSSSATSSTSAMPMMSYSQPVVNQYEGEHSPWSVEHGRALSQPELQRNGHMMSSSPIRHQPPGSSPFRASNGAGMETPGAQFEMADEEGWEEGELGAEWGEYARENSVLYSIHRERNTVMPNMTPPHPSYPYYSPAIETPSRPHQPYSNPYQNPMYPTPPYRDNPPSSGSTRLPSSSPFPSIPSTRYNLNDNDNEYDNETGEAAFGMDGVDQAPGQVEVRRRYEEANRLLAELAVARRRRWGET